MASSKKTSRGIIGLDIGGTKMDGVLWRGGRVVRSMLLSTPRTEKKFFSDLKKMIEYLSAGEAVRGVGVGFAGPVERASGRILGTTPNLNFLLGKNLVREFHSKIGLAVRVDNDAICFLLAEMRFGWAKGKSDVVALTLGTGIGGAVLAGGRIIRGKHGIAGHLGHIMIPGGELEKLAASYGFLRLGSRDPKSASRQVYSRIGAHIGVALANFTNIFDPEIFVLGGGIAQSARLFFSSAKREHKRFTIRAIRKLPSVRVTRLAHAGAVGAASLFLKK